MENKTSTQGTSPQRADSVSEIARSTVDSLGATLERGKGAIADAATEAADDARAELRALQDDLRQLKETVAKLVVQTGSEAARTVRDASATLVDRGGDMAGAARRQAGTLLHDIEANARRHPLSALAGAFFVGVIFGLSRRR